VEDVLRSFAVESAVLFAEGREKRRGSGELSFCNFFFLDPPPFLLAQLFCLLARKIKLGYSIRFSAFLSSVFVFTSVLQSCAPINVVCLRFVSFFFSSFDICFLRTKKSNEENNKKGMKKVRRV
jgi:hypothetical protein